MKIRNAYYGVGLLFLLTFAACNDKPDLTADYKDISIAYGVLNPDEEIHYFKIYKGFITDGNALVEAGNWENVYYPVDSIEVRLEEYRNGTRIHGEILDTTTAKPKDDGFFPSPKQLLYYSDMKLNPESTYRLVIRHVNTGEEVYAETPLVSNFTIRSPVNSWNMNLEKTFPIRFYEAENAAAYDLYLTFYYVEVNQKTGAVEHKSLTRHLNSSPLRAIPGGSENSYQNYVPSTIYTFLEQNITPDPDVVRYIDAVDNQPYKCLRLQVWAVNDVYMNYLDAATPNQSIVQDRQVYTNFVSDNHNAYGILASRISTQRDLMMSSLEHNEDSLVLGSHTRNLGFDYYRNSPLFLEK